MLPPEFRREHAELLLDKAAEDEVALDLMLESPKAPDSILGYHLQQAAEKLLKAVMAACGISDGPACQALSTALPRALLRGLRAWAEGQIALAMGEDA